jgi:hypothetical protein
MLPWHRLPAAPIALIAGVAAAAAVAGCGAGATPSLTSSRSSSSSTSSSRSSSPAAPAQSKSGNRGHNLTPPPSGEPASAAAVHVIEGWADALRRGDVRSAARYFRLPSVFADGSDPPVAIHNLAQAQSVNRSLPCGAELISAHRIGAEVNALFRLTGRPGPGGGSCGSGAGTTARTDFDIQKGRIVAWIRAPDQPGDNPGPPQTSTSSANGPQV